MALSIVMPALEMAQETGKLVSWKKKEGDQVAKGEMLLEVETDKAVVEIEAQADGILGGVTAKVGDVVPVGQTIALAASAGREAAGGDRADADRAHDGQGAGTPPPPRLPRPRRTWPRRDPRGSRRRRAGSRRSWAWTSAACADRGPDGEIVADDVQAAAKSASAAPAAAGRRRRRAAARLHAVRRAARPTLGAPSSSIGRLMAERTTQSWTTVPHFFVTREVDGSALVAVRDEARPGDRTNRRRQAHLHGSAGRARRARAEAASAHERQLDRQRDQGEPRREDGAGDGGERRGRRGGRQQGRRRRSGGHRGSAARSDRARPDGQADAGRHYRRDLHDQQSRDVPRRPVHRDHRAAAGGDSGGRRDDRSRGADAGRPDSDRREADVDAHAVVRPPRRRRRAGRRVPARRGRSDPERRAPPGTV